MSFSASWQERSRFHPNPAVLDPGEMREGEALSGEIVLGREELVEDSGQMGEVEGGRSDR